MKVKKIILMFFLFIIGINTVLADDVLNCFYDYDGDTFEIKINGDVIDGVEYHNFSLIVTRARLMDFDFGNGLSEAEFIAKYFRDKDESGNPINVCPSEMRVYTDIIKKAEDGENVTNFYAIVLDSSLIGESKTVTIKDFSDYTFNPDKWTTSNFNHDKSNAQPKEFGFECTPFKTLHSKLEDSPCKDNKKCSLSEKEEYNANLDKLKNFCTNSLSKSSYKNACVKNCLTFNKEKNLNISVGECGLSDKIIVWIVNIFKWVKYIVPVVVILLGLVDFMSAIASDKDDGMKKAQGKFIRRLIAAALIFIVPFILEFIIDKMGFVAEGCGIIDL